MGREPFVAAFSGSREFTERQIVYAVVRRLFVNHQAHGLAIRVGDARGLDRIVREVAPGWGIKPDVQVCYWPTGPEANAGHRWLAAHERNYRVVMGPPIASALFAFYAPGPESPGTTDALSIAREHGIPYYTYHEGRWESHAGT